MSTPPPQPKPALDVKSLPTALSALERYDVGSGRGSLVALDDLAARSSENKDFRKQLGKELINKLRANVPVPAKEFICSKLAMMGTEASATALAGFLDDTHLATAALTALRNLPGTAPDKALRKCLRSLTGLQLVGCIHALGFRRDPDSVSVLTPFLHHADIQVATAATEALGEIGSSAAAKALKDSYLRVPDPVRLRANDALLECAEHLTRASKNAEAQSICRFLEKSCPLPHVSAAAHARLRPQ